MPEENEIEFGDDVERPIFEQILDMDEDEDKEFSRSIVLGFLEQAEQTFDKMETELENRNLEQLSSLGHFLKGSSATLGFTKVKDECEKIQHFGHHKNEVGEGYEADDDKCLAKIRESLAKAKVAYEKVNVMMRAYYNEA